MNLGFSVLLVPIQVLLHLGIVARYLQFFLLGMGKVVQHVRCVSARTLRHHQLGQLRSIVTLPEPNRIRSTFSRICYQVPGCSITVWNLPCEAVLQLLPASG